MLVQCFMYIVNLRVHCTVYSMKWMCVVLCTLSLIYCSILNALSNTLLLCVCESSFGLFGTRARIPSNELFNYLSVAFAIVRAIIYGFVKATTKPQSQVCSLLFCTVGVSWSIIRARTHWHGHGWIRGPYRSRDNSIQSRKCFSGGNSRNIISLPRHRLPMRAEANACGEL